MKTRNQFLTEFSCPLPSAVLKRYPDGNIMQYWAENPADYSKFLYNPTQLDQMISGHPGVDIATFQGDKIIAPCSGRIGSVVTSNYLGGNFVTMHTEHFLDNGKECYFILYFGHLESVQELVCKPGTWVYRGDWIASEGNTGFVVSGNVRYWNNAPAGKGTHLHFQAVEYFANGTPRWKNNMGNTIDPLLLIKYNNPDYTGINILLTNMVSYLRKALASLR